MVGDGVRDEREQKKNWTKAKRSTVSGIVQGIDMVLSMCNLRMARNVNTCRLINALNAM